jgi:hypothetical protein
MVLRRRSIAAVFILAAVFMFLSACSKQQIRDLEGVPVTQPDKARLVTNVDQYPNVVALCIEGEGFVSTTRDYTSLIPVPGWGEAGGWCVDDGATVQQ